MDGGYLQVGRLKGTGSVLIVVPDGKTPFEAYQLLSEPMRINQTFEGIFEWLVHSLANAESDWKNAVPWNTPTGENIAPNGTRSFGIKFLLAEQVRKVESTLSKNNRPVAVGIPGYILPRDLEGKLFLKHSAKVQKMEVEPKDSMLVTAEQTTPNGWQSYQLKANGWGRVRLTVNYADQTQQTISLLPDQISGKGGCGFR